LQIKISNFHKDLYYIEAEIFHLIIDLDYLLRLIYLLYSLLPVSPLTETRDFVMAACAMTLPVSQNEI